MPSIEVLEENSVSRIGGGVSAATPESAATDHFHVAEYAAKGWPSIDPRSTAYCYQPCENGLHVCGFHPDGDNFLTIANFRTRGPIAARDLFNRARLELCAEDGESDDFVIDLQQMGSCNEDFPMSRQMLARLELMHAEPGDGAGHGTASAKGSA